MLLKLLPLLVLAPCIHAAGTHEGIFAVTYSNGTQRSIFYTVPRAAEGTGSRCCMQLDGEVSSFDGVRYTLHSTQDCSAASKICGLPAQAKSAWLCGCPGGDCSGEHVIVGRSQLLEAPAGAAADASMASTEQTFVQQGLPSRILALSSDKAQGSCDITGLKLEYVQRSGVVGQGGAGHTIRGVLGSGLKSDPIMSVLYQQLNGCLTYVMTKTRAGRTATAGRINPALSLASAEAPAGAHGLAGLEGLVLQQQGQRSGGQLVSLQLLWGVSKCSSDPSTQLPLRAVSAPAAASSAGPAGVTTSAATAAAAPVPPVKVQQPAATAPAAAESPAPTTGTFAARQEGPGTAPSGKDTPAAAGAKTTPAADQKQEVKGGEALQEPTIKPAATPVQAVPEGQPSSPSAPPVPTPTPAQGTPPAAPKRHGLGAAVRRFIHPAKKASKEGPAAAGAASATQQAPPPAAGVATAAVPPKAAAAAAEGTGKAPATAAEVTAAGATPAAASNSSKADSSPSKASSNPLKAVVNQVAGVKSALENLVVQAAVLAAAPEASNTTTTAQQQTPPAASSSSDKASNSDKAKAQQQPASSGTWTTASVNKAVHGPEHPTGQTAGKASGEAAAATAATAEAFPASKKLADASPAVGSSTGGSSNGGANLQGPTEKPVPRLVLEVLPTQSVDAAAAAAAEPVASHSSSTTGEAAVSSSSGSAGGSRFSPCRLSDPYCFTESECYCRLANGTYGQACTMYGSCLGACCATSGSCPSRMGFEDPKTGQKQVLLPSSCADWGLNEGAALAAPAAEGAQGWASLLECKQPKGRQCVLGQEGVACMGYTVCKDGVGGCAGVHASVLGAMCVYSLGDSSRFDVCSCMPVY